MAHPLNRRLRVNREYPCVRARVSGMRDKSGIWIHRGFQVFHFYTLRSAVNISPGTEMRYIALLARSRSLGCIVERSFKNLRPRPLRSRKIHRRSGITG
jgi:hypothetical protein